MVTAVVASLLLHRANRKYLFTLSSLLILVSVTAIATYSYLQAGCTCLITHYGLVPLIATILMFVGHALGVVPVCQLLAAEVLHSLS